MPITKPTVTNHLQRVQNAALGITTGCTSDNNINHLHDETKIQTYLRLHGSQVGQKRITPVTGPRTYVTASSAR